MRWRWLGWGLRLWCKDDSGMLGRKTASMAVDTLVEIEGLTSP